jgi:hypothetical protein
MNTIRITLTKAGAQAACTLQYRVSHWPLVDLPPPAAKQWHPGSVWRANLAQSRQGAKEEGKELREPTLCVFAPLREILLAIIQNPTSNIISLEFPRLPGLWVIIHGS